MRELRSGETLGFTLMRNHWRILWSSRGVTSDLQFRWKMTEVGHGQEQESKEPPHCPVKETTVEQELVGMVELCLFCWRNHQDLPKDQRCDRTEPGRVAVSFGNRPHPRHHLCTRWEICKRPDSTFASQTNQNLRHPGPGNNTFKNASQ